MEVETEEKDENAEERESEKVRVRGRRDVKLKECMKAWNRYIKNLLEVEQNWKKYAELRLDYDLLLEEFPLEAQKHFVLANPKGDWVFILEDIVTHPRLTEYLKTLIIDVRGGK